MATNAERAEALRTALATGVKSVTIDGITTTFQDSAQIERALGVFELRASADAAAGTGARPITRINVAINSGVDS